MSRHRAHWQAVFSGGRCLVCTTGNTPVNGERYCWWRAQMGAIRLQVIPGLAWGVRAKMEVSTVTSRAARSQSHQGDCPCRIWNPGKQPVVFLPVQQLENGCTHCLTLSQKTILKNCPAEVLCQLASNHHPLPSFQLKSASVEGMSGLSEEGLWCCMAARTGALHCLSPDRAVVIH